MVASPAHPLERRKVSSSFTRLWVADLISQTGNRLTQVALPTLAISAMHASEWQLGVLSAAKSLPFLLVGLFVGGLIDGWPNRPVLVVADTARAVALISIPVAYLAGWMTMPHLYAVCFVLGCGALFFDVTHVTIIPQLVPRSSLADANARIEGGRSLAQAAGPLLAAQGLRMLAAPFIVVLDALSFILSALLIRSVVFSPKSGPRVDRASVLKSLHAGAAYLRTQPTLLRITVATALANFVAAVTGMLLPLIVLRELALAPPALALVFAVGSLGGIAAAMGTPRASRRLGRVKLLRWCQLVATLMTAFLASSTSLTSAGLLLLLLSSLGLGLASAAYNIVQLTIRHEVVPAILLGRVNSLIRLITWGVMPLGALAGGVLASIAGVRMVCWGCVLLSLIAVVPLTRDGPAGQEFRAAP